MYCNSHLRLLQRIHWLWWLLFWKLQGPLPPSVSIQCGVSNILVLQNTRGMCFHQIWSQSHSWNLVLWISRWLAVYSSRISSYHFSFSKGVQLHPFKANESEEALEPTNLSLHHFVYGSKWWHPPILFQGIWTVRGEFLGAGWHDYITVLWFSSTNSTRRCVLHFSKR